VAADRRRIKPENVLLNARPLAVSVPTRSAGLTEGTPSMRGIVKAAAVSAITAGLLSFSTATALAGGFEIDRESHTTVVDQCVVDQRVTISSPLDLPAELLPLGEDTYNCISNEAVVINR